MHDCWHPFAAIAVEEVDVRPGGELAGSAASEIVVALDGVDFAEAIFLDIDHVAQVRAALDENPKIESLSEMGECALLDEVGDLRLRGAAESPPGVFAYKGDALIGIEEDAIAERCS